ncbi:MAG: MFS transporter [Promethearchaeota archaeon]
MVSRQSEKKRNVKGFKTVLGGPFTIFVLLAISLFNYIDRSILAPNYNLIMAEFHVIESQMGFVSTLFSITAACFTVLFGYLNDKVSRKWLLFSGSIEYSIFTILTGFSASYEHLLFFKFLTGIGIGVILPVSYSMISDLYKSSSRGKVFSIFGVALNLGDAFGAILAGNYGESGDWRTPFFLAGTFNLCSAFLILLLKSPKIAAKEEILEDILKQEGMEYQYKIKLKDLKHVYTRKTNFYLIINFIDNIPGGILLYWSITWLSSERGLPKDVASTIFLIAAAFSLVGSIAGGYFGDKWFKKNKRARVKISMLAMIFEVPFLCITVSMNFTFSEGSSIDVIFSNVPFIVSFLMFGAFFFIDSWIGPNWYSTIIDVNLPEHRGTMLSLANLVDAVGAGIGPVLGGILHGILGTYQQVFIFASLINLFGFVLWIPMFLHVRDDIKEIQSILGQRRNELIKGESHEGNTSHEVNIQ